MSDFLRFARTSLRQNNSARVLEKVVPRQVTFGVEHLGQIDVVVIPCML
jgi:hypothetical protein